MKKGFLVILYSLAGHLIFAQSNNGTNALSTPTSNNSFLNLFGPSKAMENVDVDLYTGTGKVSVPICDISSRESQLPISLDYIATRGVKIQDVANDVGLGWQLNAGGQVTRVIRGLADEQDQGYLNHNVSNDEPDIFYIKTPYFYFHFVFDAAGNPVMANGNGYKIVHNLLNNSNPTATFFEVIDDMGNQYYFGSTPNSRDVVGSIPYNYQNYPYTVTFCWYLDRIVTFNAKDVINFNYTVGNDYKVASFSNHSNCYTTAASWTTGPYYSSLVPNGTTPPTNAMGPTLYSDYTTPKYISSIISTVGAIEFTYASDRLDFSRVQRLSAVTVKAINPLAPSTYKILKTFNFNYSYFNGTSTDSNQLRLRLDNISVAGTTPATATPLTLYSFDYNIATNLPARSSAQFDFFGYFNNGTGLFSPDGSSRTPDLNSTTANILTAIHNLAGETISLSYELNSYYNNGVNNPAGGLRVNKIARTLPSGENIFTSYAYTGAGGNSSGTVYGYPLGTSGNVMTFYDIISNYATGLPGAPGSPVTFYTETLNCSPYNTYDFEGNYIGYSAVKVTNQNGGYSISNFTSFKDIEDVYNVTYGAVHPVATAPVNVSAYDYSYKRGLLTGKTIYDASGNKIKDLTNTYTSLNAPSVSAPGARQIVWNFFVVRATAAPWAPVSYSVESYGTFPENYRLTQTTERNYDQANQANYLQKQTQYTYASNNRLISTISTTDSKGQTRLQTYYHPDDTGIPMVPTSGAEPSAIAALLSANSTNIVIHESENNNGSILQLHNVYQTYSFGTFSGTYLGSTAIYAGSTLIKQATNNYDKLTANLISSYDLSGQYTSILYGYNKSVPIANITNASSTSTLSSLQQNILGSYINLPGGQAFTTTVAGNITLNLEFGAYPGANNITTVTYSLSGAGTASGTLCYSYNNSCGASSISVTLPNMPAGTYNLTASANTNVPQSNPDLAYTFSTQTYSNTYTNEFYVENFEENPKASTTGNAHTGYSFMNGNDTVTWSPPNSRQYIIQWWSYDGSKWNFNESPYTVNKILTGPVDDIRIFPTDAQLVSYTYDPMVGMTGKTDSVSQTSTFEFDGLGRPSLVRDNDRNIVKEFDYQYQVLSTPAHSLAQNHSFTRNNCLVGGIGSAVTYPIPAGKYSSIISQADADQQASNYNTANGQNYANLNGSCTYYNTPQSSAPFTRNNCATGGTSSTVVYTIAAGVYSSTVDQPTANALALAAAQAGGQANANTNGTCTFYNTVHSAPFTCACSCLYTGSVVTYTIPAGTYSSTKDQPTADALAVTAVQAGGQTYANTNGTCTTTCRGTSHKVVNCACELGVLGVISQVYTGGTGGNCVTQYGYFFTDGTHIYDHTTTVPGQCLQQ